VGSYGNEGVGVGDGDSHGQEKEVKEVKEPRK